MATRRSKGGGQSKKKANARSRAAQRMSAQGKGPDEVRPPRSITQASQSTFAGETPLSGEDRPVDVPAQALHGHDEPVRGMEPSDRTPIDEPQPASARRASSPKRRQSRAEGKRE
jgi:hypothetical protein